MLEKAKRKYRDKDTTQLHTAVYEYTAINDSQRYAPSPPPDFVVTQSPEFYLFFLLELFLFLYIYI